MSSGKTQASINYINKHPEKRFVYITPYLDEAARIKDGCPNANFIEPNNKMSDCGFTKLGHTEKLINEGRNIATTHQAFKMYDDEMLASVKDQHYTLIIDENVEILEKYDDCDSHDVDLLIDAGYINNNDGVLSVSDKEYSGAAFRELFSLLRTNKLIKVADKDESSDFFYWILQPELVQSFDDVFVLTYMFDGQCIKHYFDIYGMDYSFIGICRIGDMEYEFTDGIGDIPEYITELKDKIHIEQNKKLNEIGEIYSSLSASWFNRNKKQLDHLQKNIRNYFRTHVPDDIPSSDRLWSTYKSGKSALSGKGYTKAFLTFNAKATNAFSSSKVLVYAVNVYPNVGDILFYRHYGIEIDRDAYALSTMIQWIWRSAIRNGEEIWIYIPSRRMRNLLEGWIDRLSKGETA